jgi:dsDNA-specific endonuclease/ATPase MutS2
VLTTLADAMACMMAGELLDEAGQNARATILRGKAEGYLEREVQSLLRSQRQGKRYRPVPA